MLQAVNYGEKFGLVASNDAMTFVGLIDMNDIKKEGPYKELLDLMLYDTVGQKTVPMFGYFGKSGL